ncbi:MAG: long-chain fatty acid--CoA ligase [Gammaproteobacteria bacterium]|nr:long-chain fatty acid--CoA ligase [Gammaproteobacteria bacterium]MYK81530.1 long-chain fatty acid--CoA ligase [Gammaproteobacteria bacterium]
MNGPLTIDGCATVPQLFWKRVTDWGPKVALREKDFGIWNETTWADYGEQARLVGLGLKSLGLERGDVCSIAGEVCKEWLFADLGVNCIGGVSNGVYPTDSPEQVAYLINDSRTRFYFAEDEEQLDKVLEVRERTPTLEQIIIFDMEGLRNFSDPQCMSYAELIARGAAYGEERGADWQAAIDAAQPEDLMILTYTSGTTGPPKGAMISQGNMIFMMRNLQRIYGVYDTDEQIGFLPLAHVAGRMFYTFCGIESGCVVNLVEEPETFVQDQQEVAPTVAFAVPRVWEKQHSTITIKLKDGTALGRFAYGLALKAGLKRATFTKAGQSVPWPLRLGCAAADFLVFKNILVFLGLDRCRWLSTGAAPIAPELIDWFWAMNKPMFEVYGQTECSGLATANLPGETRIGSVGKANAEVDVRLSEEGEILIRSAGVIRGYWNKPEKTAETFRQGWLHTGDVGRIDDDGYVYIVDRMKDIIITAGGKNITPSEIENQLKFSPYVTDAVVVGDRRPYLTCLVMIDHENVTKFAQDHDVPFTNYTSLCHTQAVQDLIGGEIETVNAKFARVETIKKFKLIDQLLDPEDDELTPTQKLKRKVVHEKYADLIEAMY